MVTPQSFLVHIPWSRREFVAQAMKCKHPFDSLVCPLSSDQDTETEAARDSFEIFKGSTKSLCEEVLMTKT